MVTKISIKKTEAQHQYFATQKTRKNAEFSVFSRRAKKMQYFLWQRWMWNFETLRVETLWGKNVNAGLQIKTTLSAFFFHSSLTLTLSFLCECV